MPKILKDVSVKSTHKKYGHDMSMIRKFSSAVGQLLPVYYDFLIPGDKVRFNTEMFTQVTDIVSPAMLHITEHVDWFFVPIQQICQIATDKMFGIEDFKSSLIPAAAKLHNQPVVIPTLDITQNNLKDFYNLIYVGNQGQNVTTYNDIKGSPEVGNVPIYDEVDEMGVPCAFNLMRMFELLGLGRKLFTDFPSGNFDTYHITPLYAAAYQKIFYDNYRITDRTPNDVSAYNLDVFTDEYEVSGSTVTKLFKLHYRAFRRDYFQLTKVAPLIDYNSIGMLDRESEDPNQTLANFNNWLRPNIKAGNYSNQSLQVTAGNPQNTAVIRGLFASEKLLEITRRAAKHYDAQVLAHFGYNVPQGISGEVYRLGSEKSVLSVNEIFGTAAGTASKDGVSVVSSLGQKGGRAAGYSSAGKNLSFTAPCHGVLMAVYSAVPDSDYLPDGIDKLNTRLNRYDYFTPEYDRLGMQPLFNYESNFYKTAQDNSKILGWQYRFQEFKLKYNIVNGAFNTKYKDWTVARDHFVMGKNEQYYIYPQFCDNILLLSFQNADNDVLSYNQCYARDYLLHWFKFNVYKSSIMSTYSLPSL